MIAWLRLVPLQLKYHSLGFRGRTSRAPPTGATEIGMTGQPPSSPAIPHVTAPGSRRGITRTLILTLSPLIGFLYLLPAPPYPLQGSLDSSWQGLFDYLARHGSPIGHGVYFTYGPLGFLFATADYGQSLVAWQLFALAETLWVSAILFLLVSARSVPPTLIAALAAVVLGFSGADGMLFSAVAASGVLAIRPGSLPVRCAHTALIALAALVKFHLALLAVGAIVLACFGLLLARRWRSALVMSFVFVGAFGTGWIASGNRLTDVGLWVRYSCRIAFAYPAAMMLQESTRLLAASLAVLTFLLGLIAFNYLLRLGSRRLGWAAGLFLAVVALLSWRHGITRADDGHTMIFFCTAPLLAITAMRLAPRVPSQRAFCVCSCLALVLGILGIASTGPESVRALYWASRGDMRRKWDYYVDGARPGLSEAEASCGLPAIAAVVGNRTIDVLGNRQAYAIWNRLNYHPRPIPQSYSSYSPDLIEANAEFFRREDAPQHVMLALEPIDNNVPTLADGAAFLEVLRRYRPIVAEQGFVLMERTSTAPATAPPLADGPPQATPMGEWRAVPRTAVGNWRLLALSVNEPISARLRSFFYKPRSYRFDLRFADGSVASTRLNPLGAASGFVVFPWLENTTEVLRLWTEDASAWSPRTIEALRVAVDGNPMGWEGVPSLTSQYHIIANPLRPITAGQRAALAQGLSESISASLGLRPSARHLGAERLVEEDGRLLPLFGPGDWVALAVPPEAVALDGEWGLFSGAYWDPSQSDGIDLTAVFRPNGSAAPLRLLESAIDPRRNRSERGRIPLHVALPEHGVATLELRIGPGPSGNGDWDWAYVTDLRWVMKP
jgi:hypothetical protein